MIKVKPCPFCGGMAELDFAFGSLTYTDEYGDARTTGFYYTIKCLNEICGCRIGIYEKPMMALEAWNRRVNE